MQVHFPSAQKLAALARRQPPVTAMYSSAAVSRAQYPAVRNHGLAQPAA